MLNFPVIRLPQRLSEFLRNEVRISPTTSAVVTAMIEKDHAFMLLIQNSFAEFDSELRVESIIKNLGWKHFKDRLISIYIFRNLYGKYPVSSDLRLVEDIISFEQYFVNFTIDSNSRLTLLGVYLRFLEMHLLKHNKESISLIADFKQLYDIVALKSSKNPRIDHLLLLVWHLSHYLGAKTIKDSILSGANFDNLFEQLNEEQKTQLGSNFLSYGASVFDSELFINDKV